MARASNVHAPTPRPSGATAARGSQVRHGNADPRLVAEFEALLERKPDEGAAASDERAFAPAGTLGTDTATGRPRVAREVEREDAGAAALLATPDAGATRTRAPGGPVGTSEGVGTTGATPAMAAIVETVLGERRRADAAATRRWRFRLQGEGLLGAELEVERTASGEWRVTVRPDRERDPASRGVRSEEDAEREIGTRRFCAELERRLASAHPTLRVSAVPG